MVTSNVTRNTDNTVVVTRKPHKCEYCEEIIPAGTKVRTVNHRAYGRLRTNKRQWICNTCEIAVMNIGRIRANLLKTSFGDEGGYRATAESLSAQICDFMERCKNEEINAQLEDILKHI